MNIPSEECLEVVTAFKSIIDNPKTQTISICFVTNGVNFKTYPFLKNLPISNSIQTFLHAEEMPTYSYDYVNIFLEKDNACVRIVGDELEFLYGGEIKKVPLSRIYRLFPGKTPWFGKTNVGAILMHGKPQK